MESRLVVLLACAAAELIFNALIIWMIYLAFSKMTAKATEAMDEFQSNTNIRGWLTTLKSVSEQAVKVTGVAKDRIADFDRNLVRMQAAHAESLAKADVRFGLVFRAIRSIAKSLEGAVAWPVRHIHSASAIAQGIMDFIRGSESGDDASSRRTR